MWRWIILAITLLLTSPAHARDTDRPKELEGVDVTEKLGEPALLDVHFTDHRGQQVRFGDYLDEGKPVLLTLNYYKCKMLCSLQLNGLVNELKALDHDPGELFRVVTVSVDPREDTTLANGKREAYLKALDRGEVDWHFLTTDQRSARMLAESVGFGYAYDPSTDQYAHVAAAMMISPKGKITRYLYGIEYQPGALQTALLEAGQEQIRASVSAAVLSCFHYVDETSKNAARARLIMRIGGVLAVLMLGAALVLLWRRDLRGGDDGPMPSNSCEARRLCAAC